MFQLVKNLTFILAAQMLCGIVLGAYLLISGSAGTALGGLLLVGSLIGISISLFIADHFHGREIDIDGFGLIVGLVLLGVSLFMSALFVSFWIPVAVIGSILIYVPIGYLLGKDKN